MKLPLFLLVAVSDAAFVKVPRPLPAAWATTVEAIRADISARLLANFDTNGDGGLTLQEFRALSPSEPLFRIFEATSEGKVRMIDLEMNLHSHTIAEKHAYLTAVRASGRHAGYGTDETLGAIRDSRLNCTVAKLSSPFKSVKSRAEADGGGSTRSLSLSDVAGVLSRLVPTAPLSTPDAFDIVTRSKDVDRSGTAAMRIRAAGACMLVAKHVCGTGLGSGVNPASPVHGLPGLTGGYLLDVVRGDLPRNAVGGVAAGEGARSGNPTVPVAALARFLSFSLKLMDPDVGQAIASAVDCDGTGALDAHMVSLALAMGYSEVLSHMPPKEFMLGMEDGRPLYGTEEDYQAMEQEISEGKFVDGDDL